MYATFNKSFCLYCVANVKCNEICFVDSVEALNDNSFLQPMQPRQIRSKSVDHQTSIMADESTSLKCAKCGHDIKTNN